MSTVTLWNLLNNQVPNSKIKKGVVIPMIQRDYAQGRTDGKAREIRKVFLSKIREAIEAVKIDGSRPLELDFVYGYVEGERFIPLDGQQRLTTLFLLHWYFAFKEGKLNDFIVPFRQFSYETRQSSIDFLKRLNAGLTGDDHTAIIENNRSFESIIADKNWYYVSWKYDLTIQSMVCMLDEIHLTFRDSSITLQDLISEERPCIAFNYLDIKDFGLTDDLYIKMNARGKPLNNFENLKAELGKFIENSDFNLKYTFKLHHSSGIKGVNVEQYFVTKVDTTWTDFFWKIRNTDTNEFDDKLLNLLAFVALAELTKENVELFDKALRSFEQREHELSYYSFRSLNLLNEASIISYIDVLDLLAEDDTIIKEYLKDGTFLNKGRIVEESYGLVTRPTYEQRVIFYAVFSFLRKTRSNLDREELKKWDRLVRNLVSNRNTIYNTAKDFRESLVAIDTLLSCYAGDIHKIFLDEEVNGFDSQQIKEEKLKLRLMGQSEDWKNFILEAEAHPYLHGQIMFLLVFTELYDKYLVDSEVGSEVAALGSARMYFEKFKQTFQESGLRGFKDELFRRALLAKGDYLLYSTNWSMLIDNHRDISWKRLLKETGNRGSEYFGNRWPLLKALFDDIDNEDVEGSLQNVIKASNCTDWRKDFVENPVLMKLSGEKYLKFHDHDDDIFILRKSKYNKYADPEVKCILLKQALLKKGFAQEEIELGFIESLNQYGIIGIRGRKPKIAFNHDGQRKFFVKYRGKEDRYLTSIKQVVDFVLEAF